MTKKYSEQQTYRVRISEILKLNRDSYLISFPRPYDFKAGQVLGVFLEEDGPRRLYSICSGEGEPEIKILYKVVDEGYLTPRLSDKKEGEEIWVTPAGGEFTGSTEKAMLIATGTGVAPYYSMLRSGLGENKTLIHGSRKLEGFYFANEFSSMPDDKYVRCCSGETAEGLFHGRVTAYLEQLETLDTNIKYYLCGSAEMVVEVRDLLIARDIPFGNIISEIYF